MTQEIEVTPEVLEAVAGAVFDTAIPTEVAHTLRDWAGSLRADANPYAVEIGQLVLGVESSGSKESWFVRIGLSVLAKLKADGLLVPEDGKALTAQQWEDVRSLVGINGEIHARVRQQTSRRLRQSIDPWYTAPEPVDRCRCGVLEDEPSDGCEWHTARAENEICTNEHECPTCLARPYEFCTVSDHNSGRRQVSWAHAARTPEYRNA